MGKDDHPSLTFIKPYIKTNGTIVTTKLVKNEPWNMPERQPM